MAVEKLERSPKKGVARYSKFEKKDFLFAYLLVAVPVLNFLVFWVYVNFSSFVLAFTDPEGAFTLVNFQTVYDAFVDKDIFGINLLSSLGRSVLIWLSSHFICFPISIVNVYVLAKKIKGHYVLRTCYIIPSLMGAIIWTMLIKYMVGYDGAITSILKNLGVNLPKDALRNGLFGSDTTAFPTMITISLIMGLVGNNAVLTGAYSRIPDELFESARLDGAGFFTECFRIAIPCVFSTLSTMFIFSLCGIFVADCNVYLYTNGLGNHNTSTMGFQIFNLVYRLSAANGVGNYGYPAALGFVLTAITLPIVLIGRHFLEKVDAVEV